MTPEQARVAAQVMLAHVEKKQIQSQSRTNPEPWSDVYNPTWDWQRYDYRVKPEPREWYEIVRKCSDVVCARFKSPSDAEAWIRRSREFAENFEIVRVREVIE